MMSNQFKKGREESEIMSFLLPICLLLKGEEIVMMIIEVGSVFPLLAFPADFPNSPYPNGTCIYVCVRLSLASVSRWCNSRFSQEKARKWWSKPLLCVLGISSPAMADLSYVLSISPSLPSHHTSSCHFGSCAIHSPSSPFSIFI